MGARRRIHGFSLIEVLVALAMLGFLSAGLVSMMGHAAKNQRGLVLTDELQNEVALARMYLSKTDVCTANLPNFASTSFDRNQLSQVDYVLNKITPLGSTEPVIESDKPLKGFPASLVKIQLADMTEVVANKSYQGNLVFTLKKDPGGTGNVMGAMEVTRKLPISFDVSNSGTTQTFQSCSVFDSNALSNSDIDRLRSEMCTSLGGTYANGRCSLPPPDTSAISASICNSFGGAWNAAAGRCALQGGQGSGSQGASTPQPGVQSIESPTCGLLIIRRTDGSFLRTRVAECSGQTNLSGEDLTYH